MNLPTIGAKRPRKRPDLWVAACLRGRHELNELHHRIYFSIEIRLYAEPVGEGGLALVLYLEDFRRGDSYVPLEEASASYQVGIVDGSRGP